MIYSAWKAWPWKWFACTPQGVQTIHTDNSGKRCTQQEGFLNGLLNRKGFSNGRRQTEVKIFTDSRMARQWRFGYFHGNQDHCHHVAFLAWCKWSGCKEQDWMTIWLLVSWYIIFVLHFDMADEAIQENLSAHDLMTIDDFCPTTSLQNDLKYESNV